MVQPTMGRPLSEMERDIAAELRNSPPTANVGPPSVSAPALEMPHYVEHDEEATEIGKLSAEAVVREYEAAAKEIESMGAELLERVKQCETLTRDALGVIEELKDTAKRYREEAKRVFDHIESCSRVGAGSHDLYRIEGKDRRSSHHRRTEIKKEVRAELASDGES